MPEQHSLQAFPVVAATDTNYYACVDDYYGCVDIAYAYVCVLCMCYVCMRVCGPHLRICVLESHMSVFLFFFVLLCLLFAVAAAAVHVCITPSLKLSSSLLLWQPRYNSSRTSKSSFCDGRGRCISLRVCALYVSYENEHIIV